MEIYLVVFDKQALELSGNEFKEIQQFIDDSYVTEQRTHEYLSDSQAMRRFHSELQHTSVYPRTEKKNVFDLTVEGVNRYISSNKGESFADTLIKYVNASEMGAQSAGRDLFSGPL